MEEYKNIEISKLEEPNENFIQKNNENKPLNLNIDVSKRYDQKQIDTRWVELKMHGKLLARSYFASCIQAGKVFLHGGYNEQIGILGDMYEAQFYDLPSQWIQLRIRSPKQKNPPNLRNHTLCAYTSNLILYGGQRSMLENNSTFYKFDLRTNEWQILKVIYQTEQDSKNLKKFALDSHTTKIHSDNMYIFGGYNSQKGIYSNSIIKVNLKNIGNNQITISQIKSQGNKPFPRGNHSSCVVQNQMYIFGGTNSDSIFDDLWCFNIQTLQWKQIKRQSLDNQWPQRRKGQIMVTHLKSRSIFMFGGIKQITKQQNDIMVFLISKSKWIRIHRNTNQLYQPSPTIKKQIQDSPSIIEVKNKKNEKNYKEERNEKSIGRKEKLSSSPFKLQIKSVTVYNPKNKTQHHHDSVMTNMKSVKTQYGHMGNHPHIQSVNNMQSPLFKKHMSVVQQKKLRQFMNRKKKLLDEINSFGQSGGQGGNKNKSSASSYNFKLGGASMPISTTTSTMNVSKRPHSPTSQTIIYSLTSIGQQKTYPSSFHQELPKVIFDEEKLQLIGKKPCARDGHAGLVYDDSIIIIGGDRHMMSFNDVYLFKMDKAIQNIHLYE